MSKKDYIINYINNSIQTKQKILENTEIINIIEEISNKIVSAYKNGNKVILAGNGGSACDAQHIAGEFVSRFLKDRKPLNAIALSTNTGILTAIGNDYSFEDIFSRQLEAIGNENDIFIAISTSGNSENIIKAINKAKEKNLFTIGLTGQKPSKTDNLCDLIIKVPSEITPNIQESHIVIGHLICALVEKELFC
ncbi:MAG: D-sedoheptulose 7-phosphate isomerase [Candidatus Gastranaerophilales bacterium]|nr:D-sedoheptulose 7-phosphate isomerase [Candidatus Gastranaerophilales bacterium]